MNYCFALSHQHTASRVNGQHGELFVLSTLILHKSSATFTNLVASFFLGGSWCKGNWYQINSIYEAMHLYCWIDTVWIRKTEECSFWKGRCITKRWWYLFTVQISYACNYTYGGWLWRGNYGGAIMEGDYGGWLWRATMEGWLWRGNYGWWLWRETIEGDYGGRLWRVTMEGQLWRGDYGGRLWRETMEGDYGGWQWRVTMEGQLWRATMEGWLWRCLTMEGDYGGATMEGWIWRVTMEGQLCRGNYGGATMEGNYGGRLWGGNYGGVTMEVLDYGGAWLWRGNYGGVTMEGDYGGVTMEGKLWRRLTMEGQLWRHLTMEGQLLRGLTMEGQLWRKEIICFSLMIFQRLSAILEKYSDEHFRWKFETAINWIWNLEILSFPMMYDSHSPSQWYHLVNFWSLYHGLVLQVLPLLSVGAQQHATIDETFDLCKGSHCGWVDQGSV